MAHFYFMSVKAEPKNNPDAAFNALLSKNLQFLRAELGLTVAQTAEYANVSASALTTIESEKTRDPGYHAVRRIATLFGVTSDDLMSVDLTQQSAFNRAANRAAHFEESADTLTHLATTLNSIALSEAKKGYFRKSH